MNTSNDPWASLASSAPETEVLRDDVDDGFDDQFLPPPLLVVDGHQLQSCSEERNTFSLQFPDGDEYSKKLEERLRKLQAKQMKVSGKTMLQNLQETRDFYMNELLQSSDAPSESMSVESQTFLTKLYNTNSVYRHLHPQQALDNIEKEPIVEHDQLALNNSEQEKVADYLLK